MGKPRPKKQVKRLIKVQKNKAYFSRYQVKFKRRREGKTDYRARLRLIAQAKNKYNTPKYRLVVRFSNKVVTAQIVYSTLTGDKVMCSAYSSELPRYGLKLGLTNYAASYATGLLLARRILKQLKIDDVYEGVPEADGKNYIVEDVPGKKGAFKCYLDVGLARTTTGSKIFGVMKGAVDGGLNIPHNDKRFPGYDKESKKYDAGVIRERIFGLHLSNYMKELQDEDNDAFQKQFAGYIKNGIGVDDFEPLYKKVHAAIRADPSPAAKKEKKEEPPKRFNKRKLTYGERKNKIKQKKLDFVQKLQEADE